MSDTPTGRRVCAHAHDDLPMHWLEPGESCRQKVEALALAIEKDLDRIEAQFGPEARAAAFADLIEHLEDRAEILRAGGAA